MTLTRLAAVGLISILLSFVPIAACGGGGHAGSALTRMACVGDSRPLFLSNHMPYAQVKLDGRRGWFVVDTGTNRSGFSKKWYGDPNPLGAKVPRASFELFETHRDLVFRVDEYDHYTGDITQSGMVGTDVLARHPTTFDYVGGALYQALGQFCDDATLRRTGFYSVPIRSNNEMTYDAAPNGRRNVPIIELEVNDIRFAAQIDTGLSDGWNRSSRLSMNVNEPLVKKLQDEGYDIEFFGDEVKLTTCKPGKTDIVRAFRIVGGSFVSIIDSQGQRHTVTDVSLHLKTGPKDCGGLNAWTEPSAQLGASWFEEWGVFALDPVTKRFWVPEM